MYRVAIAGEQALSCPNGSHAVIFFTDQIIANRASTMRFIDLRQLYLNGLRSGPGRLRIHAKRSQPQNNKNENRRDGKFYHDRILPVVLFVNISESMLLPFAT